MADPSAMELVSTFGPLSRKITSVVASSLRDQLLDIEERYEDVLQSIRTDLVGATRLSYAHAKPNKQTSFANYASLACLNAKIVSPKDTRKVQLRSSCGDFLALVEVTHGNEAEYFIRLIPKDMSQPMDLIPLTEVMTFISIVALPLSANRLFDDLQALVPALRKKEIACGIRDDQTFASDETMTPEEAAKRRLRKRLRREERRRREKATLKNAERRELLKQWFTSLRRKAAYMTVVVLLAVVGWQYRDVMPSLQGVRPYDIRIPASSIGRPPVQPPVPFSKEYYKHVFDQCRMTFHFVADWIKHEGLKPGLRNDFYQHLRLAADTEIAFKDIGWYFPPPVFNESHHLTFMRDPRDTDMATHKMILNVKKFLGAYCTIFDEKVRALALQSFGPRAFSLADDDGDFPSYIKAFSIGLTQHMNEMYIFLDQNGFDWPQTGGGYLHFVSHDKDEKPYIRYKPL